jgi:hypothetical protein
MDRCDESPDDSTCPRWRSARWVIPSQTPRPGGWYAFRHTFELDRPLLAPRLSIACDSKYWLWLDGVLVVREGQLKRGPTPHDTYYDELTLQAAISSGRHILAVLVWYFGKHGFSHNNSGSPGLIFEVSNQADHMFTASGAGVRAIEHPAYLSDLEATPNYRLPESNVCFDARRNPEGWTLCDFDDRDWPLAKVVGAPPVAPWGKLVRRPIPMWRDHGMRAYVNADRLVVPDDSTQIVARLPFNCHVHPFIELEAPAGLTIDIRTDNYLGGGEPNFRAQYVTRHGRQSFEAPAWMNGHEVHYRVPSGARILELAYRRTSYDAQWTGHFECDDPALNTLWEKSCRTLDVCMRDTYMDCPDRERAQWWGDVVIQMGSAFYACEPSSATLLARKAVHELCAWQRPDATLYSPVPAGIPPASSLDQDDRRGCWDAELPAQMLASVGEYGFWTYYLYSGDRQTLERVYPVVQRYLDLWTLDDDGLVDYRTGGWDWIDWGANVDRHVSLNAWFALALRGFARMGRALGLSHDASEAERRLSRLRQAFVNRFWRVDHFRGPDSIETPDDRAQAMAVVAHLADARHTAGIKRVLATHHHAGPYMEKYVVEALLILGLVDPALNRLRDRFGSQLASPITTLWEGWAVGDATWGGGTYNHAWSGGAMTLFQQYVAGIAPTRPGFEHFRVRPSPGSLQRVISRVPTRFGLIEFDLNMTEHSARLRVPEGTSAEVILPGAARVVLGAGVHQIETGVPLVRREARAGI